MNMLKSSLAKFMPDTMDCFKVKQQAWQNDKILVLTPEQQAKLSKLEYGIIKEVADRLYKGNP